MRPTRSAGLLALGLVVATFVALALHETRPAPAPQLTIAAGVDGTSRALFTRTLAESAGERLVPSESIEGDLDAVNAGSVDLALVPGAVDFGDRPQLRQVAAPNHGLPAPSSSSSDSRAHRPPSRSPAIQAPTRLRV